jgi:hypothetical protein
MMDTVDTAFDPYAPPASSVADPLLPNASYPIWNPRAAAAWSLLFSPIFGSILYVINWRALDETQRARRVRTWLFVSIVFYLARMALTATPLVAAEVRPAVELISIAFGLVYFIVWYVAAGREQIDYVDTRFQNGYAKRAWARPLLIALLVSIVLTTLPRLVGLGLE